MPDGDSVKRNDPPERRTAAIALIGDRAGIVRACRSPSPRGDTRHNVSPGAPPACLARADCRTAADPRTISIRRELDEPALALPRIQAKEPGAMRAPARVGAHAERWLLAATNRLVKRCSERPLRRGGGSWRQPVFGRVDRGIAERRLSRRQTVAGAGAGPPPRSPPDSVELPRRTPPRARRRHRGKKPSDSFSPPPRPRRRWRPSWSTASASPSTPSTPTRSCPSAPASSSGSWYPCPGDPGGRTGWEEELTIERRHKSVPGGDLRFAPDGSVYTVATLPNG